MKMYMRTDGRQDMTSIWHYLFLHVCKYAKTENKSNLLLLPVMRLLYANTQKRIKTDSK